MPDGGLIAALLAAATAPITLLLLQLTSLIQTQYNSEVSARTDAAYHRELVGWLRSLDGRIATLVALIGRGFMPANEPQQAVAPDAGLQPGASGVQVVEADPPAALGAPSAAQAAQQELAVRQQTQQLSERLHQGQVDTTFITMLSDAEQRAKELWRLEALDSVYSHLTNSERQAVDRAIPHWETFKQTLRDAIAYNEILVLPRARAATPADAQGFYVKLRECIVSYNTLCEQTSDTPPAPDGPQRQRQAQKLRLANRALAPDLVWTAEIVAVVQKLLHMMPTICLQVTTPQPGAAASLGAWFWALGDTHATAFQPSLRLAPDARRQTEEVFSAAQLLVVLLGDVLSVGASEGSSVSAGLVPLQGLPAELQERFRQWYEMLRDTLGAKYGEAGVPGVPRTGAEADEGAATPNAVTQERHARLLARLRACVGPDNINVSPCGYSDGALLYLAAQDNEAAYEHVMYLVIEPAAVPGADEKVVISGLRRSLGGALVTMDGVDERLNEHARRCAGVYASERGSFISIADELVDEVVRRLGDRLRRRLPLNAPGR